MKVFALSSSGFMMKKKGEMKKSFKLCNLSWVDAFWGEAKQNQPDPGPMKDLFGELFEVEYTYLFRKLFLFIK